MVGGVRSDGEEYGWTGRDGGTRERERKVDLFRWGGDHEHKVKGVKMERRRRLGKAWQGGRSGCNLMEWSGSKERDGSE